MLYNLEYSDNLCEKYQKLAHLPGFVLLESSDKKNGRYDIVSAYSYEQITIKHNDPKLSNIFDYLQRLIPQSTSLCDLPFQGGAIGYFSYDLATQLAGITSQQSSLTDLPLVELGLYDWAIIADHLEKKVVLFSANTRAETVDIILEILSLWQQECTTSYSFKLNEPFKSLITKADYKKAFDSIYRDLENGRSYQVNYTQPFNAIYEGDSWQIYKQIRAKNPVPYSAFLRTSDAEILSFSPERFLTMNGRQLLTSPIKGTEKRAINQAEDGFLRQSLANSVKNRAENIMIVDLLRNDLGKIAEAGSVHVTSLCEIESYQLVHHMVSHIKATCKNQITPLQAFNACFPGGSITGAPKLESMRIISEQEPFARGIYCGSIGYFSAHGYFDSSIAIRTVVAKEHILHLAAGGGIVIDSQWEDEYLECFTKIAAIVEGLG